MMNFHSLLSGFPLAQENFRALAGVKTRTFDFGKFQIKAQFNPARAVSSGAKLDAKSIEARPCFLCKKNRPEIQKSIDYNERFEICVNPFPILDGHLTIISKEHIGQKIIPYYKDMLSLAKDLQDYVILYNGAKCGASAPDHLHFQAVFQGQLPLENDVNNLSKTNCLLDNYLRSCYVLESENLEEAQHLFTKLSTFLQSENIDETMLNVFCWYKNAQWTTAVFPRKAHRPTQFFAEGEDYMMISPGAIDMAGILVLPREEDFERINEKIISDVMSQVSI
ncbi:MAG: DUF4922 domain-containing protein [Prevotellaceae bacterium]|jgi:ATP adenylyltransferase/5',5'''-P-1,P-4-tetraphosphate phosphorylase II|nr:DUF4922 domain-containing protein [Prevotellaceae bacterium]